MSAIPHPILLSSALGVDEMVINSSTVVTKHVFYTWLAMGILLVASLLVRKKIKMVPGGLQNFFEVIIGGLENFTVDNMGEKGRKIFHILCGIFLFILVQNFLGLVPGCDAPTANVNTNAAMALFVFAYYNYMGIRYWGPKYIKHFMGPMLALAPLMLPLELISHLARPLSLTLRLFGNIFGEEKVLLLFFVLAPIVATLPIYFLFGIAKMLQAFIFFMLTMIYLDGSMEHAH